MRLLHCSVGMAGARAHRVLLEGLTLSLVDVFLKITQGLVKLQIARGLIERTVDTLVKLLFLHIHHLLDILEM